MATEDQVQSTPGFQLAQLVFAAVTALAALTTALLHYQNQPEPEKTLILNSVSVIGVEVIHPLVPTVILEPAPVTDRSVPHPGGEYLVIQGDTLYKIAGDLVEHKDKHGPLHDLWLRAIYLENRFLIEDPTHIEVGWTIQIPRQPR